MSRSESVLALLGDLNAQLNAVTAERDALRARVALLEAELQPGPTEQP